MSAPSETSSGSPPIQSEYPEPGDDLLQVPDFEAGSVSPRFHYEWTTMVETHNDQIGIYQAHKREIKLLTSPDYVSSPPDPACDPTETPRNLKDVKLSLQRVTEEIVEGLYAISWMHLPLSVKFNPDRIFDMMDMFKRENYVLKKELHWAPRVQSLAEKENLDSLARYVNGLMVFKDR